MFVIKFMAGIVDREEPGPPESPEQLEQQQRYDPHAHRVIKNPTSYSDTMMHLLKGSIGAGILAMPEAVRRLGVLASIGGLVAIGFFATSCIQILIAAQYRLCQRWRRGYMAYPKSMRLALKDGPPCLQWSQNIIPKFVEGVLIFWQLGICTIYFVFVAENIKQVMDFHNKVIPLRVHLCYVLIPAILMCLVKDLKLMTPISSLSNILTFFGLILVFFYLVEDDLELKKEMMEVKGLQYIPIFIGTALFALEAVGVVLALEYNMEHPKRFVGLFGLFNLGMTVIITLYLLVGVFGYLKYGNDIKSSVTLNLPRDQKKAQAAKIIFAVAVLLTFPLQNFVAYKIIWTKISKKFPSPAAAVCPDYTLRVVLVLIPWASGVAVPHLGAIISLIGALSLSMLAMVFPGVMDACIWYSEPEGYGFMKCRLIRDLAIVMIGLGIMTSGVYSGILEVLYGHDD